MFFFFNLPLDKFKASVMDFSARDETSQPKAQIQVV